MKVTIRIKCSNIIIKGGDEYKEKKVILPLVFDVKDGSLLPPASLLGCQLERVFDFNDLLSKQLKLKVQGFDYQFTNKDIKIN